MTEGANTLAPRTTRAYYDAAGNLASAVDARGYETDYRYDGLNRRRVVTEAANTGAPRVTRVYYDADGNVATAVDASNHQTVYAYDAVGRRTAVTEAANTALARTTTTLYDATGNVTTVIDALGHVTSYGYDALGRRTSVTDPNMGVTVTAYDPDDNVLAVTDPGQNTTTFTYDAFGRRSSMTDPLGHTSVYEYDPDDDLVSVTDRDGRRRDTVYDPFGRPTAETWYDAAGAAADVVNRTYDANDNLLTATNHNGATAVAFTYDAFNRVATRQGPFGETLTYGYDGNDNRTSVTDSFGGVTSSVYDPLNRLISRRLGGAVQTPIRADFTSTLTDGPESVTRYAGLSVSQAVGQTVYGYDPADRLTSVVHKDGAGATLAAYGSTYDAADRLSTETDNGVTRSFTYDAADQLLADGTASYSYDPNGNRTNTGYQTGPGNQILGDGTWTYAYDGEGNRVKKSNPQTGETWTYGYDHLNHMVWAEDRASDGGPLVERVAYSYDALGDRIEVDVTPAGGSTAVQRFAYDGPDVWADLDGSNQLVTRYLRGDAVDQVIARIGSTGLAAWYLTDRLGSVRDLTDGAGALIDHLDYDGFGNVLSESAPAAGDRYKFAGRELETATGLYYNRARYYDPQTGSWTGQDPAGFDAGDPNLYRYVGNAPTNATDPSGLDSVGVEGTNVVWKITQQDRRDTLQRIWDGLRGQNQNLERSVIVGRLTQSGGYLNSVIIAGDFGGYRLPLGELQQAARMVDLGKLSPGEQGAAIGLLIRRTKSGLYHSDTPTTDVLLGAIDAVGQAPFSLMYYASAHELREDSGGDYVDLGPPDTFRQIRKGLGLDIVSNENGSSYHLGQVYGDSAMLASQALRAAMPGGLGGNAPKGTFPNQLPERLAGELADAAKVGARPIQFGDPGFSKAINGGTIKYVVTESGEVIITPHTVKGVEISHAVLSNGQNVVAAGQAEIASSGGKFFGINLNNHSGHFMPTAESLQTAREAFAKIGIVFP